MCLRERKLVRLALYQVMVRPAQPDIVLCRPEIRMDRKGVAQHGAIYQQGMRVLPLPGIAK